jgi:hypothetical protein
MEYNNSSNARNKIETKNIKQASKKEPKEKKIDIELYKNKWHQLLKEYPQVHISPEAESILIKPKDTMVLSEKYHELSSNSFLLHAYYNYRQLLLFRYNETGEYYIGVPGIYYDRQQRIACMFGFEGFENGNLDTQSTLQNGSFGYFMKRVEI